MNFEQLEKIIAKNSSSKGLDIKSTPTTIRNGDNTTMAQNTSLNSVFLTQHDKSQEQQQGIVPTHVSPKDYRSQTNKSFEKSFFTNDNISFNLQTTLQSACANNNSETMGLLKEQLTKIKLLSNDLQIKDQQIDIIKEQMIELENEKQQIEQLYYDIQKQLRFNEDDFNIRLLALQEKNESLVEFNQQLQQRIQIQNEQIQQYQSDLAQYRIIIEKYDLDKQNLANEVSQVKGVLKGIQQSTVGSREQMTLLMSETENRGIEIEKKKQIIEQLEQLNEKNKTKIEKLKKQVASKDEKINDMEQQIQKVEKLTSENQKYCQENSQLRVDLNALKMRYEESMRSLEDTRAGLARQIQAKGQLEENSELLQKDIQQSKKIQSELKKKSESIINDNLQLKEQLIEFEQMNMRLQRDQDFVILELGEFAKDKLDEYEGDPVLTQLRNHQVSLMMLVNGNGDNGVLSSVSHKYSTKSNQSQFNEEEEDLQNVEFDESDSNRKHNDSSAVESNISNSFTNQSRASIKNFQNAIICNRLSSIDSNSKREKKRSTSNPKPPQNAKKKAVGIKKKHNQSQNESVSNQQTHQTIRQVIDFEGMSTSEQLRTRISYLASMVGMYKKKVEILENQQQNLNGTIEKLQDHVDQLQQFTVLNKAQQENSLFAIKEEYEEKIIKMKDLFEQNEEEFQNKLYNCDEQVMELQGEIEFLKNSQEQRQEEFSDLEGKYYEAQRQIQALIKLENELQNSDRKVILLVGIIEKFLFGIMYVYSSLQKRLKDLTLSKKFFEYYFTMNNVLNPLGVKQIQNTTETGQNRNQSNNKKQQIYKLFRKAVNSVLFIVRIRLFYIKGATSQTSLYSNWPNRTIKNAFVSSKKQTSNSESLTDQIKRIIDINISKSNNSNSNNVEQSTQIVAEIIEKFNQLSQNSFNQEWIPSKRGPEDSLFQKFQRDANKVSKMIKQNETFQTELNKMTQRVLALSEYTRQVEGQFKENEKFLENKYKSEISEKDNSIQNLKNQLINYNSNNLSQSNNNFSENKLQNSSSYNNRVNNSFSQYNSPPQNNLINHSQMIPPLPPSTLQTVQQYHNNQQQQQQQQQLQQQQQNLHQQQLLQQQQQQQLLQTSQNTEESRSLIKNQSSLIRKYYTQGVTSNISMEHNHANGLNQSQNGSQKSLQNSIQQHNLQNSHDNSNFHNYSHDNSQMDHSSIPQNEHLSVDSLQNELNKIMQRKNQRDSSNHSSGSKLPKCPGKIIRNTNKQ